MLHESSGLKSEIRGISLSDLNQRIQESLKGSFTSALWVVAEVSEITTAANGHCYLELIEKDGVSARVLARIRATIWSSVFRMLKPYFENSTGYRLSAGMKILFSASVEFHEVYGLSLNIRDIEPSYSLGDMARRKAEIVKRLKDEGVLTMNSLLALPLVPQRIAVISSKTAAGYGDFTDSLLRNSRGYHFELRLFPALMQGEQTAASVMEALDAIFSSEEEFDLVAILRGGGAQADLDSFNNYDLAYYITQFPLPVITGIGHERDETVTDLVAHTNLKTPTAVAEFILDLMASFDGLLDEFVYRTERIARDMVSGETRRISTFVQRLTGLSVGRLERSKAEISLLEKHFTTSVNGYLKLEIAHLERYNKSLIQNIYYLTSRYTGVVSTMDERFRRLLVRFFGDKGTSLMRYERTVSHLDPARVLERGYSITMASGKPVKDVRALSEGSLLETRYHKGKSFSRVEKIIKD
jgi:exodeoxyribonuclease VII large subunit